MGANKIEARVPRSGQPAMLYSGQPMKRSPDWHLSTSRADGTSVHAIATNDATLQAPVKWSLEDYHHPLIHMLTAWCIS